MHCPPRTLLALARRRASTALLFPRTATPTSTTPPAADQVKLQPPAECLTDPMLHTCFPPSEPFYLPFFEEVRGRHAFVLTFLT